jgi:hypothetical protein
MTEQSNLIDLQSWWAELSFPEKDQYQLKENGELVLRQIGKHRERTIVALTPESAAVAYKALTDKFPEVAARIKELQTEWVAAEDKLKLSGKVERTRDYLLHANAIGDYNTLLQLVDDWAHTAHELSEENYKLKQKIAEQAEELVNNGNFKEATQAFRELTDKWKSIGYADKAKSDELWARIENARNKFYERKRDNQAQQEHELLQNLDLKMELVEKAENLTASEDWKETTETFRQLMDEWKKTGRTMHDKNEELWQRFITAKNTFHDRKKIHFEQIQAEQQDNYQAKLAIVEKAEAIKDSTDWHNTSQAYTDLMEEWKAIGRVPADKSDEIWERLIAAKEFFFQAKRQHFESVRVTLDDNYARKMALLNRAEALKRSTQWHETSQEMNELLDEWKKVGPVPREHSNAIWEQFITARKYFYERKDAYRDQRKQQAEKFASNKLTGTRDYINQLMNDIKEEGEKIIDFRNDVENITPGARKEHELRSHLQNLITQSEGEITRKQAKLEQVKKELEDLEKKAKVTPPEKHAPKEGASPVEQAPQENIPSEE